MLTFFFILCFLSYVLITLFAPVAASVVLLLVLTCETFPVEICGFQFTLAQWAQHLFVAGAFIRWWITLEQADWDAAKPALGISIAVLLSTPFSFSPVSSFFSSLEMIQQAFTFYFVFWFIKTSPSKLRFHSILPVFILFFVIVSLIQYMNGNPVETFRIHAGLANWNICAVILVGFLPFLMIRFQPLTINKQLVYSIVWTILIVGLILGTRSRSGVLLLGISVLIMILCGMVNRKVVIFIAMAAIVALLSAVVLKLTGIADLSGKLQAIINSPRVQERSENALLAFMTLAKHPFTGMGIGQWEHYGIWAYPDLSFALTPEYSSFMLLLAETGLIGGFASVYFFQCLFSPNTGLKNKQNDPLLKAVHASLWIWIAASFLYSIHLHGFCWVWLGFLAGYCHSKPELTHSSS